MTDIAELHAQALDATGRIVAGIPPGRWHAGTPCQGWDVRALLNHVVSGNLWAAELAAGATIEGVGDRLDGDVLGPDPARSYDASAAAAAAAFRGPGALDASCAVSYGPVPGSVYAGHRFLDVFIHGWDLAAATGQDTTLDSGLMEACREVIEPQLELFRQAGAIGQALPAVPGRNRPDPVPGRARPQRMTPVTALGPVQDLLARASSRRRVQPADARAGAAYERVTASGDAYFVKRLSPASDWIMRVTGDHVHRPYLVWQAGIMGQVPGCIDHAVVAMELDGTGDQAVLTVLMRDIGEHLVPPGDTMVPASQHESFIAHLAALSARFWGWRDDIGLTTMAQRLRFFAPGNIAAELAAPQVPPPVAAAAAGWRALPGRAPLLASVARLVHDRPEVITGPLAPDPPHVPARRLEDGQPRHPSRRADDPAGLGLSRRRAGLLGPVLVPRAQPGPPLRAQASRDRPFPGRTGASRHRHRRLVAEAARPVPDRHHGHLRVGEGTRRRR